MMTLHDKLCSCGFLDNQYLLQYIQLIQCPNNTAEYTEKHHIIPRSYFKLNHLAVDNSADNLVRLSYIEHCKAHVLLCKCTCGALQRANIIAVDYIVHAYKTITGYNKGLEFLESDYQILHKYFLDVRGLYPHYYSVAEDDCIRQKYQELGTLYGLAIVCAKILNRSVDSVRHRIKALGLSKSYPDWSAVEIQIMRQYFPSEGYAVADRLPQRNHKSVRAEAKKLGLKTKGHFFTTAEINLIKEKYPSLSIKQLADLLPNRTYASVKHYIQRHRLLNKEGTYEIK